MVLDSCIDGQCRGRSALPRCRPVLVGQDGSERPVPRASAARDAGDATRPGVGGEHRRRLRGAGGVAAEPSRHADGGARGRHRSRGAARRGPPERELAAWRARHERRDGHGHVHGANLGLTLGPLRRRRGFPRAAHEDVLLVDRLRRPASAGSASGAARRRPRAPGRSGPGGFATYLRFRPARPPRRRPMPRDRRGPPTSTMPTRDARRRPGGRSRSGLAPSLRLGADPDETEPPAAPRPTPARRPRPERLVVVVAHPDDETLATAGLLAWAADTAADCRRGRDRRGGLAPGQPHPSTPRTCAAAARRGGRGGRRPRPDRAPRPARAPGRPRGRPRGPGRGGARRPGGPDTLVVSTWRHDAHADHEAVARVASAVAARVGARHLEAPIWLWHWGEPGDVPGTAPGCPSARTSRTAEAQALAAYPSQHGALSPEPGDAPVLEPRMLAALPPPLRDLRRDRTQPDRLAAVDGAAPARCVFERAPPRRPRPLGSRTPGTSAASAPTRWPPARGADRDGCSRSGCSVGVLTAELAERADHVVAIDVSEAALARRGAGRCAGAVGAVRAAPGARGVADGLLRRRRALRDRLLPHPAPVARVLGARAPRSPRQRCCSCTGGTRSRAGRSTDRRARARRHLAAAARLQLATRWSTTTSCSTCSGRRRRSLAQEDRPAATSGPAPGTRRVDSTL